MVAMMVKWLLLRCDTNFYGDWVMVIMVMGLFCNGDLVMIAMVMGIHLP